MSKTRIIHNRILGGWYVVVGAYDTPISGRFSGKSEAEAWLERRKVRINNAKSRPAKLRRHS